MNFNFLKHIQIYDEESLTSYLSRLATVNYVNNHDIWRKLMICDSHYPQASFSRILDITPHTVINVNTLCEMLKLESNDIFNMTFVKIYNKFAISLDEISTSKVLMNSVCDYRKYCPMCMKDKNIYKLIWQVEEINYCKDHKIYLYDCCWNCKRKIPLLSSNSENGYCPFCGSDLSKGSPIKIYLNDDIKNPIEDWAFLLNKKNPPMDIIKNYSITRTIALKLLYIGIDNAHAFLLQKARGTHTVNRNTNICWLLKILREKKITVQDFFNLKVPNEFIESILYHESLMINNFACISPWCKNYNKLGLLKRTATSSRKQITGEVHNFYMYCPECSIEYYITHNTKEIKERGYFINLGWEKVKDLIKQDMTLIQMASKLNTTKDKIKRCIIFLVTNNLTDVNINDLPIEVPAEINKRIFNDICVLIKDGEAIRKIQKLLKLKYNDYLFYYFRKDVRILKINTYHKISKKLIPTNQKYGEAVLVALDKCITEKQAITVEGISKKVGVCHETLRNAELLSVIKEEKKRQKLINDEQFKKELYEKAISIMEKAKKDGQVVKSTTLYKKLGHRRNFLTRKFPDLTQQIYKLNMKERKNHGEGSCNK